MTEVKALAGTFLFFQLLESNITQQKDLNELTQKFEEKFALYSQMKIEFDQLQAQEKSI